MKFTAPIEINKINPYILVSPERAAKIKEGWRKPLPVLVKINGKPSVPWKINMMPIGDGSFYLYLNGYVRKESNSNVGDIVNVEVSFDEEYRAGPMHPMPPWFDDALSQNAKAKSAWNLLIPSRQKEILRYFAQLKSNEAQKRNLDKAMRVLSGRKERFMARSWNETNK